MMTGQSVNMLKKTKESEKEELGIYLKFKCTSNTTGGVGGGRGAAEGLIQAAPAWI